MSRKQVNWLKNFRRQVRPALDKRLHESAPGPAVITQRRFSVMQIALKCNRGAIVKGMRQGTRRVNPFESVIRQRQRGKKWRPRGEWIHRRSEVMEKSGQGKFQRSHGASRLGLRLKNVYLQSVLSENDGRRKPVGTGADNASFAGHLRCSLGCELMGA